MRDILKILRDIEGMKGAGSQKRIATHLKENWSEELEYVLDVALNQFKPTHIGKVEIHIYDVSQSTIYPFGIFKELMNECMHVKACTDTLRERVNSFITSFDVDEDRRILGMIITKSLNIGLGRKLVNKAAGRQILPTPEAHLANKDLTLLDKWECDKVRVNIKYDGYRLLARFDGEEWSLFTRNFNEFDKNAMNNIIDQLNKLFYEQIKGGAKFFVDGELIAKDSIVAGENSSAARQSVASIANRIIKGGGEPDIDKDLEYVIFDLDSYDTLNRGKGVIAYDERRDYLEYCFNGTSKIYIPNLSVAKEWIIPKENCMVEIKKIYNKLIAQGEEGVIIKDPTSVYECGRKKSWLKMKEILTADLRIKELIEGTGKNVGRLGAVLVEFSTGETVSVGSGFSDALRDAYWLNRESMVGRIIEIEYNAKCSDKHGNKSVFLPVFKNLRSDKTEADKY